MLQNPRMLYPSNCCWNANINGIMELQNGEGLVATDFLKLRSKSNTVKVAPSPLFSAE